MPIHLAAAVRRRSTVSLICIVLVFGGLVVGASPALATNIEVEPTNDGIANDGVCGLREAVIAANTNAAVGGCPAGEPGNDTISLNPGTYDLTVNGTGEDDSQTGDLDVLESVSFVGLGAGPGAVVIDAGGVPFPDDFCLESMGNGGSGSFGEGPLGNGGLHDRVLHILDEEQDQNGGTLGGPLFNVSIDGITVQGGELGPDTGFPGGGGILNEVASLRVENSNIQDNTVFPAGGKGGGSDTAIGGGIALFDDARLVLIDSKVRRNAAVAPSFAAGGGIANEAFILLVAGEADGDELLESFGEEESAGSPPAGISPDIVVTDSQVTRNLACSFFAAGGGGLSGRGLIEIEGSTFERNGAVSSLAFGGGAEVGSGFFSEGGEGVNNTTIRRSVFDGNLALSIDTGSGSPFEQFVALGGGLINSDGVDVTTTTFRDNVAEGFAVSGPSDDSSYLGGGMAHTAGTADVNRTTFQDNEANPQDAPQARSFGLEGPGEPPSGGTGFVVEGRGGGLYTEDAAHVLNSTFSGNTADVGGGLAHAAPGDIPPPPPEGGPAGEDSGGQLSLEFDTISDNTAETGGGLFVDGSLSSPGIAELEASIIATQDAGADCAQPGKGDVIGSNGFNIDSDDTCDLNALTDQPNTDPDLVELADNGGPTMTHALVPSSPAVDWIGAKSCGRKIDQRGVRRPQNGDGQGNSLCDVGAFELEEEVEVEFCPGFKNDPRPQLVGTGQPDVINGSAANEVICGLGDDDTLRGRGGKDLVIGGKADDDLFGGPADDVLQGSGGADEAEGNKGDDRIRGFTGPDHLVGNAGNDAIGGGRGEDDIGGGKGGDTLLGWGDNDLVSGGAGPDDIEGTGKHDVLLGGPGPDMLRGFKGDDAIFGNAGRDRLVGYLGDDELDGGPARDECFGGPGTNMLVNCEP